MSMKRHLAWNIFFGTVAVIQIMNSKQYLLAPVQTIFPELKIKAVVLGSLILMITAAKR